MKKINKLSLILIFLIPFISGCIQNIFRCPVDTLSLKQECEIDRKAEEDKKLLLLLALVAGGGGGGGKSSAIVGDSYNYGEISGETNALLSKISGKDSNCPAGISGNAGLTRAAQSHSYDMSVNTRFSHIGSNGSKPHERVKNQGGLTNFSSTPLDSWKTGTTTTSIAYTSLETEIATDGSSGNGFKTTTSISGIQDWTGIAEVIVKDAVSSQDAYAKAILDPAYSILFKNYCDLGYTHVGIGRNQTSNNYRWTIVFAKDPI